MSPGSLFFSSALRLVARCASRQLAVPGVLVLALLSLAAAPAPGHEPILPIPPAVAQDPARVALGRALFGDVRLSANDRVACSSCHDLGAGGADRRARSIGFAGAATAFNTPTVFNAALNFRQFWSGRAGTLEAQIVAVVESPVEMGAHWPDVVRKLAAEPTYRRAFAAAYAEGLSQRTVVDALASFERTLTTPDAPFDRYLRGDAGAITADEKAGYATFKRYGCVACHQGVNVGGNMFQKFGIFGQPGTAERAAVKVPSLRNVALTAPYLDDGSAATLDDAVEAMFVYQLGRTASAADKASIVRFLLTLTGERRP